MWKIARIGQGNHKKAWKQEIRREHNSNPLQRQSHVLVVFPCFPSQYATQFLLVEWWPIPIYLFIFHFGMCGHIIMMIWDELMFLIHAVLSTGTHSPSMRSNMHARPYWWPAWNDVVDLEHSLLFNILCIVHVHDVVTDWSYALVWFLVSTLFCGSPGQS